MLIQRNLNSWASQERNTKLKKKTIEHRLRCVEGKQRPALLVVCGAFIARRSGCSCPQTIWPVVPHSRRCYASWSPCKGRAVVRMSPRRGLNKKPYLILKYPFFKLQCVLAKESRRDKNTNYLRRFIQIFNIKKKHHILTQHWKWKINILYYINIPILILNI